MTEGLLQTSTPSSPRRLLSGIERMVDNYERSTKNDDTGDKYSSKELNNDHNDDEELSAKNTVVGIDNKLASSNIQNFANGHEKEGLEGNIINPSTTILKPSLEDINRNISEESYEWGEFQ